MHPQSNVRAHHWSRGILETAARDPAVNPSQISIPTTAEVLWNKSDAVFWNLGTMLATAKNNDTTNKKTMKPQIISHGRSGNVNPKNLTSSSGVPKTWPIKSAAAKEAIALRVSRSSASCLVSTAAPSGCPILTWTRFSRFPVYQSTIAASLLVQRPVDLLRRDGEVAHADADSVCDGVRYRGRGLRVGLLADALDLVRPQPPPCSSSSSTVRSSGRSATVHHPTGGQPLLAAYAV